MPFIVLFVGMQVVAENEPTLAPAKRVFDAVLVVFGFGLISWVAVEAATDTQARRRLWTPGSYSNVIGL